jgi:hypothetical protein
MKESHQTEYDGAPFWLTVGKRKRPPNPSREPPQFWEFADKQADVRVFRFLPQMTGLKRTFSTAGDKMI